MKGDLEQLPISLLLLSTQKFALQLHNPATGKFVYLFICLVDYLFC